MEAEIEVSRRFKIALNETELREIMYWYENLKDEREPGGSDLADELYSQLAALQNGTPLNVESPPVSESSGVVQVQQDPANFARLRQSSQQGKPVIGGEWLERS